MNETKLIQQLGEALQEASDHLDYCGYGDKWERECADYAGLRPKIEAALRDLDAHTKRPHLLRARVAGDTIRDLIEALQQLDPDLKHGVEEVVRMSCGSVDGLNDPNLTEEIETLRAALEEIADEEETQTVGAARAIATEALL